MERETELAIIRRAYAKQILAAVGVTHAGVEAAFAAVRREDFLGPGPWQIFRYGAAYRPTPSDDPVYLYTDNLVGLVPERRINNGQPSLHAYLLAAARPKPDEHIVHVGAGTGYYSAIMAELVGGGGQVTAIEFDEDLASRAAANLSGRSHVRVIQGDGAQVAFADADVIYVNAGATAPARAWLERLRDGGRLILPLTTEKGFSAVRSGKMAQQGAIFRIERRGADYDAKWISPVAIFPCTGNRDASEEAALAAALANGRMRDVSRLYRGTPPMPEDCWLVGADWSLAYR